MKAQWLQVRWDALARRERALVLLASSAVLLLVLWWVGLAPALAVLRTSDAQQAALDLQLREIGALQAQAQALQAQPRMQFDDALRALETSVTQRLGAGAQLTVAADRVSVTFKGVPADTLAQWLTQARISARAVPAEARLVRSPVPTGAPAGAAAPAPTWDGTLVLSLPARQ